LPLTTSTYRGRGAVSAEFNHQLARERKDRTLLGVVEVAVEDFLCTLAREES
jgi:hypothetical protein